VTVKCTGIKKWAGPVAMARKCKACNVDKIREVEYRGQADFDISNLIIKVKRIHDTLGKACFAVPCFCGSCYLLNLVQEPSHYLLPCVSSVAAHCTT
jgi:hypothetical protein